MTKAHRREDDHQQEAPQQTHQTEQVEQSTEKRVTETQQAPADDQQDSGSDEQPQTGRRPDFIAEDDSAEEGAE